jgi:hypothetical protein
MNTPALRASNGQTVAVGTGEALLGPCPAGMRNASVHNRRAREMAGSHDDCHDDPRSNFLYVFEELVPPGSEAMGFDPQLPADLLELFAPEQPKDHIHLPTR